ncbi:MAG: metalloregulator ArsR/SmtB family transcription factor [Bdellovibrionaceae bacterium]|nr:metalloregulator ArsR/SmtB family transcription factor [Pseudobdellovibrionaceae bacterium]NUM59376.1 winged helix-turn-helix transcriptional regulator [Pseudobdellovibrionaceae bacterium]
MSRSKKYPAQISLTKIKTCCGEICLILKALSHPQRLLILGHLVNGPKTVSELGNLTGVSQSQLSQFLIRMKAEGLLTSVRKGKFQFYELADSRLYQLLLTIQKEYG